MITNITLQNFKCFHRLAISPNLVTVLIGPNGTGKSSVLQALCLLKQWSPNETGLTLAGSLLQLSPNEFVNQATRTGIPQVGLSMAGLWECADEAIDSPVEFELDFVFSPDAETISKKAGAGFEIGGALARTLPASPQTEGLPALLIGHTIAGHTTDVPGARVAQMGNMFSLHADHRDSLNRALACPGNLLAAMRFVPAVRGFGRRTYRLGTDLHEDILVTDGLSMQEDAMATTIAYSEPYRGVVSGWMERVTGVGIKFPVVPPQSVHPVSITPFGAPSLLAEGSGTNALVHLLFELARARSGATVLIEEPEIHLHPGAQAELASVIAGEAKASNKQVIMTTHSEHIAGRLMIEVAEGNLSPDDIAIYSFEKDDNGVCSASEIEVSENGQVAGGLRSFFQTDLDEMRRYVDALRAKA